MVVVVVVVVLVLVVVLIVVVVVATAEAVEIITPGMLATNSCVTLQIVYLIV